MSFYRPMVGVREDFNSLLTDFVATKSVRFAEFVLLWRARKMPLIFSGRQDDRECREVSTESDFEVELLTTSQSQILIFPNIFQYLQLISITIFTKLNDGPIWLN